MADIAINPVDRRVQFTGNTGLGPFAFTFNILADADIVAYKNTTLLTLTTDYTVTTNANGTGSITLTGSGNGTALIASDVLTIIGGRELSRTTDFVTAGDLLASSLNEQLDSQVIMAQQLDEKMTRALKVNPGDEFTSLELPLKDSRKGKYLAFNATTGDPEAGASSDDVATLAAITDDIATLADIEDGTDATDAIQTVAGISANVTTVAGVSANVTTVAGISSDVTAVAGDATDIGTVATNIANVNTVAGNDANITTVAGISANVTTVAGDSADIQAVAADATDIGTVATNIADVNTAAANITDIQNASTNAATATTKAAEAATSASNAATSETNAATSASAAAASQTAAAASAASAASAFDNFDDTYLGSKTSDPTVDNDGDPLTQGDLYFNSTANEMRVYDGANWIAATSAGGVSLILYEYTATSGQTTFSGADDNAATLSYTADNLQVVMNGIVLDPSDFTATDGTSVVLASGAAAGSLINIYAFKSFTVADTVSASSGGTFSANVTVSGTVTANQLDTDNIRIDGNTISSTDTNGDITLDPDGTGDLIVASGNLGIGTSSPAQALEISGTAPTIRLTDTGASNNYSEINADYTSGSIHISADTANASANSRIMFQVDNTERMRIDSSGRLLVNTTSTLANGASAKLQVYGATGIGVALQNDSAGQQTLGIWNKGDSGTRYFVWFESSSGRSAVGSITSDGSSTSYNTTSDHRLKEAVVDMTGAIDRVKALAPKRFNWIADPDDRTVDGFLAHEAQAVVPEAVTGTHNEVDEDGNAVMQGIDQSKLVPLLTGALQEAIAKIETLEAKVTALENAS